MLSGTLKVSLAIGLSNRASSLDEGLTVGGGRTGSEGAPSLFLPSSPKSSLYRLLICP